MKKFWFFIFYLSILKSIAQKNETVDIKAIAKPNPKGKQTFLFIRNNIFLV
jgi:hypothetical protein